MREVPKDEFYRRMGPLNVHPRIINDRWPYTSEWALQNGSREIVGKSVGNGDGTSTYFLASP